jgi:hypothetical protein
MKTHAKVLEGHLKRKAALEATFSSNTLAQGVA